MPEPLSGPAVEPLTLAEAKAFLRVDGPDEDSLIGALITAARRFVEARTGRILIFQDWRMMRDAWPASGVIAAPVSPVAEILSAQVTLADGSVAEVPAGGLLLKGERAPALIHVDPALVPLPGPAAGGIAITYRAGYGADAASVPADLIQAVRLLVAHFHEHRDGAGDALAFPDAVEALLAPYRVVRL